MQKPKRKNPRDPARVLALQARLVKLQPRTLMGPGLSAKTLRALQFAGLKHLIPRDPPLAERWLEALEQAVTLECGTLLAVGPDERKLARQSLEKFPRLVLTPGAPKVGEDWGRVELDVVRIATEIERLKERAPASATIEWWTGKLNRVVWRFHLGQTRQLEGLDIYNVRESKSNRAASIYLVALSRHEDPKRLDENLSKWRRRQRPVATA